MFGADPREYEIKGELSTCCYGIGYVYIAKHKVTREFVALKRFKMDNAKEESNLIRVSDYEHANVGDDGIHSMIVLFTGRSYNNASIQFSTYLIVAYGICE